MSDHYMETQDADRGSDDESHDAVPRLAAEIVMAGNGQTECTVFPLDLTGHDRLTRWITARDGSYVCLENML